MRHAKIILRCLLWLALAILAIFLAVPVVSYWGLRIWYEALE
jgi:hypothetical protein